MPAYNFQPQFESDIMADRKRHTIRAPRKRRPRVGDTCYLFVGMRRKEGCRRLKERRCTRVQQILIGPYCATVVDPIQALIISVDGVCLTYDERQAFARSDGFPSLAEMAAFWIRKHKLDKKPWRGDLIHWESNAEHKERIIREAVQAFKRDRNRAHLPGRRAGRIPKD